MSPKRAKSTRRQFLSQLGATAVASCAACGATAYLLRRRGELAPVKPIGFRDVLPQGHGGKGSDIYPGGLAVAEMSDHAAAVRAAIEAIGGIGRCVGPGDVVLVKPNVGFDRPPWVGATTSPEVVAAVVELCREAGAAKVLVTDYPINDPAGCFARSGIGPAAKQAGATVLLPSQRDFQPVWIGGKRLKQWPAMLRPFLRHKVTRVIGVPTAKTHARAVISGAIKNWYGLLGGPRNLLHQDLDQVLADLGGMVRPALVVMDATRLLMRNGPTGGSRSDVKAAHRIIAGTDAVAIDTLTAEWLGKDPAKIEWLHLAEYYSVGMMDYKKRLRKVP